MSDEVNQFLSSIHVWALSWKELIITHNEAQGQAIKANLAELQEFLPPLPSSVSVEESPFCSWSFLSPDEQDRREDVVNKNKANLAQFQAPPFGGSIAVGGSVVGASPGLDLDDLSAAATHATPQQQHQSQSAAAAEKRLAMYKLFGATVDNGVLKPPQFREGVEDILSETSKKEGAFMLASQLKDIDEENDDSRDRLLHQSHFTGADDEVQMGFIYHLKGGGKTNSMKSMSTTTKGFTSLVFMPDTPALRKQREALAKGREIRDIEEMQEESETNRTKLDTTILVADNIAHLSQLKTLLANCVLFCMSVYEYDPVKNESNAPTLHSMAFRFEATIVSRTFRDWFDTLSTYAKAEFQYWLLTQIETILQYLLEMCSAITHLPKARKGNFGGIPVNKHNYANDLIDLAVDQMVSWVTSGAVSTSASALFQSSTYYQRKIEAEKKAAVAEATEAAAAAAKASLKRTSPSPRTPPPGRQSSASGGPVLVPPPQPPRSNGEIICTGREFPMINRSTLGGCHLLCIAHIKHGTRGCMYKDSCRFDHPASIADWQPFVRLQNTVIRGSAALPSHHSSSSVPSLLSTTPSSGFGSALAASALKARKRPVLVHQSTSVASATSPAISSSTFSTHISAKASTARLKATPQVSRRPSNSAVNRPRSSQSSQSAIATLPAKTLFRSPSKVFVPSPSPPASKVGDELISQYNLRFLGVESSAPHSLQSKSFHPPLDLLFMSISNLQDQRPPWRSTLPSFSALLRTPFGMPDLQHNFVKVPSFSNITFHLFKSGLLDFYGFAALCYTHPLFHHLASRMVALSSVDFRSLREFDPQWASCGKIPKGKEQQFLALFFHYDMNISAVVRFLGSKYLGGHRDVNAACRIMEQYGVSPANIAHYRRIMTVGCPSRFTAETTHDNFEVYRLHGKTHPLLAIGNWWKRIC
ncbi:LOW QUALITY PROTEIN: hypothetical protein ACHAWC_006018 [Mediolabrus comicus]